MSSTVAHALKQPKKLLPLFQNSKYYFWEIGFVLL